MASTSGIPELGDLPPGAHIGHLYRNKADLLETLVPYFAAGMAQRERCVWVTSEPLRAADARAALANHVPDLARREAAGEIEIIDHDAWYLRSGNLGPDEVIALWLAHEERALREGFLGLRISGNTFWLAPDQWQSFADYEARVHAAFEGRRIVAMCSYSLAKCHSHEIVDIMRNHPLALVRGGTRWSVVHGATAALASLELAPPAVTQTRSHVVEFYSAEFPADRVADRLVRALEAGHAAVAVAATHHLGALRVAFTARGVDVSTMLSTQRLALLDADELHRRVRLPSGVDLQAFEALVLPALLPLIEQCGEVVLYGELVDRFAQAGDHASAIALEDWWNEKIARYPITLSCGYSLSSFADGTGVSAFQHVCDTHGAVGLDADPGRGENDRLPAELAQVNRALAGEMSRRNALEAAYETARAGREQLVLLERLAASLAEVTTGGQLATVITDIVSRALEFDGIVVLEARGSNDATMLVGHGSGVESMRVLASTLDRALWSADGSALPGGGPLRSVVGLPLFAHGTYLGACVFGFLQPRPLSATYRALAQDVIRQLALALDRSRTYARLDHERARAEQASRAKDEFLAMLGHELRNPLSPILTASQLMRMRGSDVNERERTVIERQVKHMMRLVDDLLDVSRITQGKIELRRKPVDLSEILAQAIELASPALEERAHRFTLDAPDSGIIVHADPQRLVQVLCNLLTNAAKYTPRSGDLRLSVRGAASTVSIYVVDNGNGIDGKLLPHIFDLFVQGRQGIDRASGGLGLGLAIARSICEMHGGTIRAHSEGAGKGSEVVVELPRFANARPSRANITGGFAMPAVRGRRVLVVDDNEDAAFLFSEALKRLGHEVTVAYDGPSALASVGDQPPEIAFLDIGLPVMDGYELGRRLLELGGQPPRLVAVTGYGHSSDRERSRDAGFDLHLVKPIELSAVQAALAKLG